MSDSMTFIKIICLLGKECYFKNLVSVKEYFADDGNILARKLEELTIVSLEQWEIEELLANGVYIDGISEKNFYHRTQAKNLLFLEYKVNFQEFIGDTVKNIISEEESISDEELLRKIKKAILLKSKEEKHFLRALELEDSVLIYFINKQGKK